MTPNSFRRTDVMPGVIHGASIAFRKALCDGIGEFDVLLGAGAIICSAEDLEYIARASWSGCVGMYTPVPTVRHHHRRRSPEDDIKLKRGYELGIGAYYMKRLLRSESRLLTLNAWYWSSWPNNLPVATRLIREMRGALTYLYCRYLFKGS